MSVRSLESSPEGAVAARTGEHETLKSYSSSSGVLAALGQWRNLTRHHQQGLDSRVAGVVGELREVEAHVLEDTGAQIKNCRVLDIGPGQHLMQMAYFAARGNDVVGVDRDVIVQGFDPLGYWRMARWNGLGRVVKTVGRKALGIDRSYRRELRGQLGLRHSIPRLTVLHRNAWDTGLEAGSFDFIYSLRTFMHVHDPEGAMHEAARLLAPGGVAYVDLMPYTGPTGSLDIRVLGGRGDELPAWAHLRRQHRHLVQESAHLNRLSLSEWRDLVAQAMPGSTLRLAQPGAEEFRPLAEELHQQGELLEFPAEDLVTSQLRITWRKVRAALSLIGVLAEDAFDLLVRGVGWAIEITMQTPFLP
jgi:SAM-dependent methyltransferase